MTASPLRHPLLAAALVLLSGCASTSAPVVYPPADEAGTATADADLQICRERAAATVGMHGAEAAQAGGTAVRRGTIDFVDKAVESLVNGSREAWARARGAGAGAMAGSLTAVALTWNEPDAVYRNYVELCLKERGHKVLGWR